MSLRSLAAHAAPLALALAALPACSGIDAGVEYPDMSTDVDALVVTPEGDSGPSLTLGQFRIKDDICKDIDTHPVVTPLTPEDFTRFLETVGAKVPPRKARGNLYWFDFKNGDGGFVRLRLAVLESPQGAAKDLHDSLLEHGPGWWGVRRSNLAVLAPKTSVHEALQFALQWRLPCWGMMAYTGNDDVYTITGPYAQL